MALRKKAAVDLDGVICDFLSEVQRHWGEPRIPLTWTLEEMYPDISDEQIDALVNSPQIYLRLKPLPGAIQGVRALMRRYYVVYITMRPMVVREETRTWLEHYGVLAKAFYTDDKAQFVNDRKFAIAIEDHLDTARAMAQVCPKVFLVDQLYNAGPCGRAMRIGSWEHQNWWPEILKELGDS